MFLIFLQLVLVNSQEYSNNDNIVVGNLKRREQIPLSQINRRFGNNLNYRKTKDIRDEGMDRRREIDTNREIVFDRQRDNVIFNKRDDRETFDRKRDYYNQNRDDIQDIKIRNKINDPRDELFALNRDEFSARNRDELLARNRDELLARNREESISPIGEDIFDTKRNEPYDRSWEEFWDKRDNGFDTKREEIYQRYDDKKRGEIWDRRFEQSEREANRLEDTNDKLQSLHQDLRWLTINTDEGIGIGI